MAFTTPKRWHHWLAMAEWWYNTCYHTAIGMTPFQALYGTPPPMVAENVLPDSLNEEVRTLLQQRQTTMQLLKDNLLKAQDRMKHFADKNRSERVLDVDTMVYLKLQPYRHTSLSLHRSLKLHSRYYGPFRVLERIGKVAYKLLLPDGCQLHNVFHVSQLKQHLGPKAVPTPHLPLVDAQGNIQIAPEAVLSRRTVPRVGSGNIQVATSQWLIKWINLPPEAATWEDAAFIEKIFPRFHP